MKKPLLICMTATKNYGWCTDLFLKANALWADYIVVVDQMSTDNTRELVEACDKAILVDNLDTGYSETIRCKLAIDCARGVCGNGGG